MKAVAQKNGEVACRSDALVRVLLLEESLADSQDILEELRAGGMTIEPTVLATRQEFLEAITAQDFSIVLSTYELPGWSGLEAFEELQRDAVHPRNQCPGRT
jgi:CheY-like chemotaxis protein